MMDPQVLKRFVALAEETGQQILACNRAASQKEDGSDLTAADLLAHALLTEGILKIMGDNTVILSEESAEEKPDITKGTVFVIDPLDGTTEFKEFNRNFAVLLAILQDGIPVYGISVAPAYGVTACGGILTGEAELLHHQRQHIPGVTPYWHAKKIQSIENDLHGVIVPQRFMEATDPDEIAIMQDAMNNFQGHFNETSFTGTKYIMGSILPVLKDNIRYRLYEAIRPNQKPGDWDLAAWDAILRGVGGIMTYTDGQPIVYGRRDEMFRHQNFICWRKENEAQAYAAKLSSLPASHGKPVI